MGRKVVPYDSKSDLPRLKIFSQTVFLFSGTNRHNVFFLKQLEHARALRNRIIECFERASSSNCSKAERERLLTFLVVGGGKLFK